MTNIYKFHTKAAEIAILLFDKMTKVRQSEIQQPSPEKPPNVVEYFKKKVDASNSNALSNNINN